jgi:hypothetical protein
LQIVNAKWQESLTHPFAQLSSTGTRETNFRCLYITATNLCRRARIVNCFANGGRSVGDANSQWVRSTGAPFANNTHIRVDDYCFCFATAAVHTDNRVLRPHPPRA